MIKRVRNLQPGQEFILNRTGQRFKFIRRDRKSPSGTIYVVKEVNQDRESRLHHSCHIEITESGCRQ
jgi:hypothetical protein